MKKILLGLVAGLALTTFAAQAIADEAPAEKKEAKKAPKKAKKEKKEEAPAPAK